MPTPSGFAGARYSRRGSNDRLAKRHQLMLYLMRLFGALDMRTTINIDDDLLAKAAKLTGPLDRSAMVREGLKALIERESAKRLARLGGTQPELKPAPRRRQEK